MTYTIAEHHIKAYKDLNSILDDPKADPRHRRAAENCLLYISKQAIAEAIAEEEEK